MLLDPKEDVQLQPPVMETDSKVDDGNYCMVYIVLPYLHLLSSKLTTYIPLPGIYYLHFVASMKRQVHQRLWLFFHPYRSSHRSSSTKSHLSEPKYVNICMIRSGWFTCSPLQLFAITFNGSTFWSGWNEWLSLIWLHTSSFKNPRKMHDCSLLRWKQLLE